MNEVEPTDAFSAAVELIRANDSARELSQAQKITQSDADRIHHADEVYTNSQE